MHPLSEASEAALAHQDQRTPWRRPQGRDPLRDFTPCAIFAQPSKVPVVFHHAFLGRTTRCHVPVAADARSTKGTGMFPAHLARLGSARHCSRPSWAAPCVRDGAGRPFVLCMNPIHALTFTRMHSHPSTSVHRNKTQAAVGRARHTTKRGRRHA